MPLYLTVDIGGSSIKYACADEQCRLSGKGKTDTPLDGKASLFETLGQIMRGVSKEVKAVAISMPGVIDRKRGYVYSGGRLDYLKNIDFAGELEAFLDKKVTICNDARAAVMAEMKLGNLKGLKNGLALIFGTGVGGGIMLNGEIYEGSHFAAGEFSSIVGNIERKKDIMCIFAVTNGIYGLKEEVFRHTGEKEVDGYEVFRRIRAGDDRMIRAMKDFCERIAYYLYNLQVVLDVERVVIGGGISGEELFIRFLKESAENYFSCLADRNTIVCPEILPCRFRNDANLIGAMCNYMESLSGN